MRPRTFSLAAAAWLRPLAGFIGAVALTLASCREQEPTEPPAAGGPTVVPPTTVAAVTNVLAGAGDIARCDKQNDEATARLLDSIPGTVFTAGDNVLASGSSSDFSNCYGSSWGRHQARTRPAPGEHDYLTAGAAGYFGYFGTAAGEPGNGYYSYDLGGWHIVALNSNISTSAGSPQEQWLRADLATTTAQCILAYWHHPRFSSRGTAVRSSVKPLWDDLYAARADVVVNSHYRIYERFAPQNPAGGSDPENGIRQFTVGTGGQTADPIDAAQPNSEVRNSGTYGVLKLGPTTDGYAWEFVPVAGKTFTDAGSASCHRTRTVSSVEITPSSATIEAGKTVQLTATPRDAQGNPMVRPVTWSSDHPGTASVTSGGLVTGLAEGSATITAMSDGQSGVSAIGVTPAPPGAVPVLVGAGDIASCTTAGDEATAQLLDTIAGTVFTTGDNVYDLGSDLDFANCYHPTWGRHKARTRPSPGNNDYDTPGAAGYFGYFGTAAGEPGKGYYSYDLGGWHIIALNSNISTSAGSTQEKWLRADLAASTRQCILAYWHHPRFTSSSGRTTRASVEPLWRALYGYGADLILNAHDHDYERFAPQAPDGSSDPANGIRQITVGTGGRSLYRFGTPAPNSQVRDGSSYGVLKLTLYPDSAAWKFVPVAGKTFSDSGTTVCHGVPGSGGTSLNPINTAAPTGHIRPPG
jgi:hypothetical protein